MKSFFAELDLYKAIIVLSLVLIPVVGYWAYSLDQQIVVGEKAIANALRAGGDLEEIGKFQKAVEEQRRNRHQQSGQDSHELYFQKHMLQAGRLSVTNFEFKPARENIVTAKGVIDTEVEITFEDANAKGRKLQLTREEIMVILFNCESQSKIWMLREFSMNNATLGRGSRGKAPPPELEEKWIIDKLVFASRRPIRPGS